MKKLTTAGAEKLGPFDRIEEHPNGYLCYPVGGGTPCDYPFSVVGQCQVGDWDAPVPLPTTPERQVPASVGSGQIRAALIASGVAADDDAMTATIEGILANIPDPTQRAIAVTLWRNASEFRRDHQFIAVVQAALGKTSAQIDDLFRLAATF